jgi:preprotein translocase subunit SecF
VVRGFTIALIWGVVVGACSSVYVASPRIIHLKLRREVQETLAAGAA